ncbi:Eco57I restriction-modification methylase domain-containing protein [Saccharolobus islandicus]|uniref:site-specific DNA-methyltransferase (adenine-specific) n=1 Tax=Saccharolobus islandicus LAL14/1 TaxID=1241935 RepID=M9U7D3_SACIS|nr:methyltransferase domain-containing protein [Sulfolobus islandicus]AGJ62052.1 Adenine-specific DNA methylase [Sulfolobus islandicus LAL14/1]
MVSKLFSNPSPNARVLDAGCGEGVFIEAIIKWYSERGIELPEIVGVEIDHKLAERARKKFNNISKVKIIEDDFLTVKEEKLGGEFDYIISNPPYISYEKISPEKRKLYKSIFEAAVGRFDIYMLFFERALNLLKPGGRMVFLTPEKYLYVISAGKLRKLLSRYRVVEIELINAFEGILAYPTITVIEKIPSDNQTIIKNREGKVISVFLPKRRIALVNVHWEFRL